MSQAAASNSPEAAGFFGQRNRILYAIVALAGVLLIVGQAVFAWYALRGFENELRPQLERKAEAVSQSVGSLLEYGLVDLGIPATELNGVEAYFDDVIRENSEIGSMTLVDAQDREIFRAERGAADGAASVDDEETIVARREIWVDGAPSATLITRIGAEYVGSRLSDIYFDVATVIVVSWLVTVEFMIFIINISIISPLRNIEQVLANGRVGKFTQRIALRRNDESGRAISNLNSLLTALRERYEDFLFEVQEIANAQIDSSISSKVRAVRDKLDARFQFFGDREIFIAASIQIRIPLFLLIFAEEMSRSFLPILVGRLSPSSEGFSAELLLGLPITLFMLLSALATPISGVICDRIGARKVFLIGVIPSLVGYFGTFLAAGYYDFILWRALTGIGYGIIMIAAQAWVAEHSHGSNRAQDMSIFAGAVIAGMVCGPPIGGVIADRLGYEVTFLLSAAIAAISFIVVYLLIDDRGRPSRARKPAKDDTRSVWRPLLLDRRFMAVSLLLAMPGKFIAAGFFFFLVPLYLFELDNSPSVIGWIMMLYGIVTFASMPLVSWFADRTRQYHRIAGSGVALAAIGCMFHLIDPSIIDGTWCVVLSIIALGVGHALSLTSQLAMVVETALSRFGLEGQGATISAYRLLERIGPILGPMIAASFAYSFGYRGAIAAVGILTLLCAIGFFALYGSARSDPHEMAEPT